jgi:hypothetical protein
LIINYLSIDFWFQENFELRIFWCAKLHLWQTQMPARFHSLRTQCIPQFSKVFETLKLKHWVNSRFEVD